MNLFEYIDKNKDFTLATINQVYLRTHINFIEIQSPLFTK